MYLTHRLAHIAQTLYQADSTESKLSGMFGDFRYFLIKESVNFPVFLFVNIPWDAKYETRKTRDETENNKTPTSLIEGLY